MEASQEKSNTEHQSENDGPVQFPKIVDLNDFCLINIFGHLDLKSLLNVADTNKQLRPAAFDVYKRKFGAKIVDIYAYKVRFSIGYNLKELSNAIEIRDVKTCLQYLRCFGPFINDLSMGYHDLESAFYEHIHEYVNNYCAESLVHIKFDGMENIVIGQFQKVFAKIESVAFADCDLGDQWSSFVALFSNLSRLEFQDVRIVYRSIDKPFRNLEHLSIQRNFEYHDCDEFAPIDIAIDLLNGIHQLKSLEIDEPKMSIDQLLDLIKDNRSITKLTSKGFGRVTSGDIQRLVSEHPSLIELDLENTLFAPGDVIELTRQLGSLKRFEFHTQVNYCSTERSDFESQLADEWAICVGDTGCNLRTFMYDMHITIFRRAQET